MAEENTLARSVGGWPGAIRSYVDDLNSEMRRVTWPQWKQVRATTVVVILSVFAFAAYFYVVDQVTFRLVGGIMNFFSK
ncbi:MAG: preprotein translocase subunit SecE [Bryobacterales bacterium]|nr:preprotein translocase subunit SecE [Bryobacterales bacterium]